MNQIREDWTLKGAMAGQAGRRTRGTGGEEVMPTLWGRGRGDACSDVHVESTRCEV